MHSRWIVWMHGCGQTISVPFAFDWHRQQYPPCGLPKCCLAGGYLKAGERVVADAEIASHQDPRTLNSEFVLRDHVEEVANVFGLHFFEIAIQ